MGTDLVAVDATCCRLMKLPAERIPTLMLGAMKKLGRMAEADIPQLGEPIEKLAQAYEWPPKLEKQLLPAKWAAWRKRGREFFPGPGRMRPGPGRHSRPLFRYRSTGVPSISRLTMSSGLTPSASALKFVMIRCRSTGAATARMSSVAT